MITILISILIAMVIATLTIKRDWKNHKEYDEYSPSDTIVLTTPFNRFCMCIWRPIVALFFGFIVGVIFAMIIGIFFPKKITIENTDILSSVNNNFVVTKNIGTTPFYFYYCKTECGLELNKIKTDDALIVEQDSTIPRIEYLARKFIDSNVFLWALPTRGSYDARIFIPKNSLK